MIRRIDQGAERCKEGEKKDKERMVADEFCPPCQKMDGVGSDPFYHRKESEEISPSTFPGLKSGGLAPPKYQLDAIGFMIKKYGLKNKRG
jgi:hypothetical protein